MSDVAPANDRSFHFNHQRILVMDDEAAIRELTSQLLGTLGYEVTAVPDGSKRSAFTNAPCAVAKTSRR